MVLLAEQEWKAALEGYGNSKCPSYRMPISDHVPVFEWTSNHQVLCAVTLQHVEQHTWTLRATEMKEVRAKVADVIAAQGGAATSRSRPAAASGDRAKRWANKQKPAKRVRPASADAAATERAASEVAGIISAAAEAARVGRGSRAAARAAACAAAHSTP